MSPSPSHRYWYQGHFQINILHIKLHLPPGEDNLWHSSDPLCLRALLDINTYVHLYGSGDTTLFMAHSAVWTMQYYGQPSHRTSFHIDYRLTGNIPRLSNILFNEMIRSLGVPECFRLCSLVKFSLKVKSVRCHFISMFFLLFLHWLKKNGPFQMFPEDWTVSRLGPVGW